MPASQIDDNDSQMIVTSPQVDVQPKNQKPKKSLRQLKRELDSRRKAQHAKMDLSDFSTPIRRLNRHIFDKDIALYKKNEIAELRKEGGDVNGDKKLTSIDDDAVALLSQVVFRKMKTQINDIYNGVSLNGSHAPTEEQVRNYLLSRSSSDVAKKLQAYIDIRIPIVKEHYKIKERVYKSRVKKSSEEKTAKKAKTSSKK
jgi:hypothetical protein